MRVEKRNGVETAGGVSKGIKIRSVRIHCVDDGSARRGTKENGNTVSQRRAAFARVARVHKNLLRARESLCQKSVLGALRGRKCIVDGAGERRTRFRSEVPGGRGKAGAPPEIDRGG